MNLFISDVSLFDEVFFEKADFVPEQKKGDLSSYSHLVSKKEHILAWSMLSYVFKTETGSEISDISLGYSEKGKPYLKSNPFFFSLSHSDGRVICAADEGEVGADVQKIKAAKASVAGRVLCENEKRLYEKCGNKPQCFTRLWTLKESYVKLTGEGITAGLNRLDFSPAIEKDSFCLFDKQFFTFDDGEFSYSVCSLHEEVTIRHIDPKDFFCLFK